MKIFLASISLACASVPAAFAGSFDVAPPASTTITPPLSASISDWSGAYAGGAIGFAEGDISYNHISANASNGPWPFDGTQFGGFAGYNYQSGALVYGVELAFQAGKLEIPAFQNADQGFETILDAKARFGFAARKVLLVGIVGWSHGSYYETSGANPGLAPYSGFAYGVGIDYRINDKWFVGVQYLSRDLMQNTPPAGWEVVSPVEDVQIRAGISF